MTMRSPLLAVLLLAAACGGSSAPKPAPEVAPAPAEPAQPTAAEAAAASEEAVVLELRVERDRVDVDIAGTHQSIPNVGGAVNGAAITAAIGGIDFDGGAIIRLADDAPYGALVAAMDVAVREGIRDLGLEAPDDPSDAAVEAPPPTTPTTDVKAMPILLISSTDVTLRLPEGAPQPSVAIGKVADLLAQRDPEIPALRTAVGALAPHPDVVVVQADQATPGALFNRALRTLKRLGVEKQLLAIKNKK